MTVYKCLHNMFKKKWRWVNEEIFKSQKFNE